MGVPYYYYLGTSIALLVIAINYSINYTYDKTNTYTTN